MAADRIALVYCRVSTTAQGEEGTSLDSQQAACVQHAESLGFTVGRITREIFSGAELWERPNLAEDRADIRAGKFQALVVYSTDRLSRDPIHLALIDDECEQAGTELIFVTEPLDRTDEGKLIQYVKGYANKLERERIRERFMRGKRQRAYNGKVHNLGPELYGYRRDKSAGVRVIYEPEATIVRQIFEWVVVEHLGVLAVARRLNDMGEPPPSAGKLTFKDPDRRPRWGKNQISRMLAHTAYKGEPYAWRTRHAAKAKDRKRSDFDPKEHTLFRPREQWISLPPETTPAIVTPVLWQQAQDALTARSATQTTRNRHAPYLLRGMVRCATCGSAMYSDIEKGGSPVAHRIYRCSSRQKTGGSCGSGRIDAQQVEDAVWEQVREVLKHPEILAEEAQRHRDQGPDDTPEHDLETAKRELAKREKKQAKLLQQFTESDDDSAFPWELVQQEIKRLEDDKNQWKTTIAKIEGRIRSEVVEAEEMDALSAYCADYAETIDGFGFEEKRRALELLDIRVVGNGQHWDVHGRVRLEMGATTKKGPVLSPQSEQVVAARRRDLQRPLHMLLAAHVG